MVPPTVHIPVLLQEVIQWSGLERPSTNNRTVIDGTLGGGGHAWHLIQALKPQDFLVGIDRDAGAIDRVTELFDRLLPPNTEQDSESNSTVARSTCRVRLIQSSYRELPKLMVEHDIPKADCILLDLGLSSDQLEDTTRGFSFRTGGTLDLRFCTDDGISAADLLAKIDEKELADIIYQFGEEKFSRRIARAIVERRRSNPVRTAEDLADLVHRCVPGGRVHGRIDSATRTFQALRIAVNNELEHLKTAIERLPDCLAPGGRLLIISFHSLEDRIVKHAMRECDRLQVLTKKPVLPSDAETYENPRSRSAKLRIAERV
ncbi:MAG: 16S rRNA (cytosine(1402)-N(4))-methyltransferase RsmH [Planctomycetota bacterium]|jgi:16S rRNA (cytosine1402-N4)-methyltransferase|nr:16S rRNA (cytosine(1402)-N(4))-methyltransferase RsmH [Planctomycetota bacterium]